MLLSDVPFSLARRRIVQAGFVAGACAARIPFALAMPDPSVAEGPTAQALLQAVRTLVPHATLGAEPYLEIVRAIETRAEQDAAFRELITSGLRRLPADFAALDSAASTAALGMEVGTPFFNALRTAAGALYRNPVVWPHFGYPGPSLGFGGYVDRPILDLAWLEESER
ncbi:MAG: hypothetical protein WD928_07425 [Gammaproteobacteria bacterium]